MLKLQKPDYDDLVYSLARFVVVFIIKINHFFSVEISVHRAIVVLPTNTLELSRQSSPLLI